MGVFDRLTSDFVDTFDPEYADLQNPYAQWEAPFSSGGSPDSKQGILRELVPETQSVPERFVSGAMGDVRDLARGFGSLIGNTLYHPLDTAAAVGSAALHPIDTAEKLAEPFVENYTPQGDEGVLGMLTRNVIDHPFRTLMDAAALAGGAGAALKGAGAVSRIGMLTDAGEAVSAGAAALDPVNFALRTGTKLARTAVPGLAEKLDATKTLESLNQERQLRAEAINRVTHERLHGEGGVFADLTEEDMPLFHPYVEGRVQLTRPGPDGMPAPFDPEQYTRLETARQRYAQVLDDQARALGTDPESVAQAAGKSALDKLGADVDPAAPEVQGTFQDAYETALSRAQQDQVDRATVSMRTQLTEARQAEWEQQVNAVRAQNDAHDLESAVSGLPSQPSPASSEEALQHLATQGALYFPHSGEVLTKDQATVGNILTKRREALPWKMNRGAMYRSGLITEGTEELARAGEEGGGVVRYADPRDLLDRHFQRVNDLGSFSKMLHDFGEQIGRKIAPSESIGTNPETYAGREQFFAPHARVRDYAMLEEAQQLYEGLAKHAADSPAAAGANLMDAVDGMVTNADRMFPVKRGDVYAIPTGAGDAFASFMKDLEPPTSLAVRALDRIGDAWRFTTLPLRPMWIVNNVVGNTVFNAMYGMHPMNPSAWSSYFDAFKGAAARKLGWFGEEGAKLGRVYDLPGVTDAGLSRAAASRTARLLSGEADAATAGGRVAQRAAQLAGGKVLAGVADVTSKFNRGVEDYFRAASTIYGLKKAAKTAISDAGESFVHSASTADRLAELAAKGPGVLGEADYRTALDATNKFLNDYSRVRALGPVPARVLRRVMPFQAFYRHAVGLALHSPFERPVQTALIRSTARSIQKDVRDQLETWGFNYDRDVPDWMKDSVPVNLGEDERGNPVVHLISSKGPNPFSALGVLDPGSDAVAQLNPIIKVALETVTGVDLFRWEKIHGPLTTYSGQEIDPTTGEPTEMTHRVPVVENLGRQFWPYQEAEQALSHGRTPFATSTLLDMLTNAPGTYQRDATGRERRRPIAGTVRSALEGPVLPTSQFVQLPTGEQSESRNRVFTDELNRLGREHPELRDRIRELELENARAGLGADGGYFPRLRR